MFARNAFKAFYRVVMTLVTLTFLVAAFFAYWYSTPANGLLLVAVLALGIALVSGLSISRYDDEDRQLESNREIIDEVRSAIPISMQLGRSVFTGEPVTYSVAEPEVHRLDQQALDEAKAMAARGEPIDSICCFVDPAFDGRAPTYKQAFRKLVQSMIEQA